MAVCKAKANRIYTYADYEAWDDDQRWELIEGVPYSMTPGPNVRHQTILGDLYLTVANFLKNRECKVFFAPCDVLFPEGNEGEKTVKNVFQPDLFVVCDENKIKEKYIFGAPDWVVEILSPSTSKKDQSLKKRVYEKAGVKEFWVVCPVYATVSVFKLLDGKLQLEDVYDETAELEISFLPGLKISAADFLPSIKRVKEEGSDYESRTAL